ncbi:MAG: hypothetical protein HFE47_00545 [Clostridia bacterium]|nr:hypothetical protein [Clostridia bacterium]
MQWIWNGEAKAGEYAEFRCAFTLSEKQAVLKIGADWEYAAYINGVFAANGQYVDGAGVKTVDEIDISSLVRVGNNELVIVAYHMGGDYSAGRASAACVGFRIASGNKTVAESGKNTQSRPFRKIYAESYLMTPQYGLCWGYNLAEQSEKWTDSVVVTPDFTERERLNKRFILTEPLPVTVCAQGIYKENGGETAAEIMQNAWLSARRFSEMTNEKRLTHAQLIAPLTFTAKGGDGVYIIVDTEKETAGYLSLCVTVKKSCRALLGWGEHLSDLRVRTAIGGRNFGSFLTLNKGENILYDDIHRMGARYLCLFVPCDAVTLSVFSLREAVYPFADISKDFGDRLLNRIYETGKRTLQLCAHAHYEDCPWREQALYGMDSRNQMLFGYGVFGEYELPRAGLRDMMGGLGPDGLPELCPPSRNVLTIPSFALYWFLAFGENVRADYNSDFVREMLPAADKMFEVFRAKLHADGVHNFTASRYWNFYEWVDGLDGGMIFRDGIIPETSDAILTALFVSSAKEMAFVHRAAGNENAAREYEKLGSDAACTLEKFYDAKSGLYFSFLDDKGKGYGLHGYTQAVILLTDAVPQERTARMTQALKKPPENMGKCTFATLQAKYDAIVQYSGDTEFCLNEICELFGGMLFKGATSYWETAEGEADFEDAGSLCHAWSSVPCYFMNKYLGK